jgi:lipopolysaccharide heptosyltransferase II
MKKILIIRMSSIGDIILATSFLDSVKKKYPNSSIDFLIKKEFSPLLQNHPYINNVIELDKSEGLKGLINLGKYLKHQGYYKVFDIHNVFRSKILSFFFKRKIFFQIKKPRLKRFMLFNLKLNFFKKDFSHIRMYHSILEDIHSFPRTSLYVSSDEINMAKSFLKKEGVDQEFICIVPGAAWKQKQLPVDKYNELIDTLNKKFALKIVLLGSKNDTICDEIKKDINIVNLKDKTSLRMAMSILTISEHTFGSDTGLLHASEALNTPVSMILGPTSMETGASINHPNSKIFEKNNLWCRPCSQNGKRPCIRKEQYCLTGININEIAGTFQRSC